MSLNPLVSICIPTYNGEAYLEQALASAVNQSYSPIEIIVSDDQSKDNTIAIAKQFKKNVNPPINIYKHSPKGMAANWNHCLRIAKGEYIKFLFQDDALHQDCLKKMMELIRQYPDLGLVFCRREVLSNPKLIQHKDWINKFGELQKNWESLDEVNEGKTMLGTKFLLNDPINKIGEPTAVLLSRELISKCGMFNEKLIQFTDVEYWYRALAFSKVGFVDERLVAFRLHPGQASSTNDKKEIRQDRLLFYRSLLFSKSFNYLSFNSKIKLIKEGIVKPIFTKS